MVTDWLHKAYQLSERRSCRVTGIYRSLFRYRSIKRNDSLYRIAIRDTAQSKPRYGYRRILVLFRRQVYKIGKDMTYRIYREEGLQVRTKRRKKTVSRRRISIDRPKSVNKVWSMDFVHDELTSGEKIRLLTIVDHFSRESVAVDVGKSLRAAQVVDCLNRLKNTRGLPKIITVDNVPFASANSLFNLSKLSVWWLRLGIQIERIQPGCPQQNGRHERMHLTLKKEATKPAGQNILQQQAKFDEFLEEYNTDRPHEALEMKYPSEVYERSDRSYQGILPLEYPMHDREIEVTSCGRICIGKMKINLSKVFMGQKLGLRQVSNETWLVTFMDYDLGYFDTDSCRFEQLTNPFGPKVLPMS